MAFKIHVAAAAAAMLLISLFLASTLAIETFGAPAAIVEVKVAIRAGLALLIPSLVAASLTGRALAVRPGVSVKARRAKLIALNGVLVLAPAAIVLAHWAEAGRFDVWFYGVQAAELAFGAANLTLLALNARDGSRISRRRRTPRGR